MAVVHFGVTRVAKVRASVAATLLSWLVLVLANALVGLVGTPELAVVACTWILSMLYIWSR